MSLFKPLDPLQVARNLDGYFARRLAKKPARPLQIRVFSPKLSLDYAFPSDSTGQPFHVASIGKVFTAVLMQRQIQRGDFTLDLPIQQIFSPGELEQLFVYKGVDYAPQVTIRHLLGHTSGIADYIEGRTKSGKSFLDGILSAPHTRWAPEELVAFTREQQAAVGIPGQVFNYSDTGYILLGLIIERINGESFAQNLADEIFRPLGMGDSYLMFSGSPQYPPKKDLAEIWFNGVEISRFESLSCDWAGGGIVATTADLLKFSQALRGGQLVPPGALEAMDACTHRFRPGIYYGLGMMEIRFKELFFLLGRLPRVKGHIGILATHMFYDPANDAHILMNFGDNTRMVESFQALIQIENTLQRMQPVGVGRQR